MPDIEQFDRNMKRFADVLECEELLLFECVIFFIMTCYSQGHKHQLYVDYFRSGQVKDILKSPRNKYKIYVKIGTNQAGRSLKIINGLVNLTNF